MLRKMNFSGLVSQRKQEKENPNVFLKNLIFK